MDGDRESLSALLEQVRPTVYRWAARKTLDPDDAEDVTQNVLLKVAAKLHTFRRDSRLSSWLYRITMNEATGFYRKRAREAERGKAFLELNDGTLRAQPEVRRIDEQRAVDAILRFASTLPPLQLSSFRLIDVDGLRPAEAAGRLGKSQGNVRSSLCRARKRIRYLVLQARRELVDEWVTAG
jgi:RNA polymerase sigma-70 factor (ECF subfamily)